MDNVIMKCGCAAQGTSNGKPVCVVHFRHGGPDDPGCVVAEEQPKLEGRIAKCGYCHNVQPSSPNLAFFKYKPAESKDEYYCGCFGWD